MMRGGPDGPPTTRMEGGPASALGPQTRLVTRGRDDGVWKCGPPKNGGPHSHNASTRRSLTRDSRFIEETESTEAKRRRVDESILSLSAPRAARSGERERRISQASSCF